MLHVTIVEGSYPELFKENWTERDAGLLVRLARAHDCQCGSDCCRGYGRSIYTVGRFSDEMQNKKEVVI